MSLTLQFVRPLARKRLAQRIYDGLNPQGCLILIEKVLAEQTLLNRLFIDHYYDFKRRNGYSDLEIAQKREALENVLVPFRLGGEPRAARLGRLQHDRSLLQVVQLLRPGRAAMTAPSPPAGAVPQPAPGNTDTASATDTLIASIGRVVFRFRDLLVPVTILAVLIAAPPRLASGNVRVDAWMDLVGFAVAASGQALRYLVIGYAYVQRGGAKKRLSAPALVAEGVYAHSRNPMYLGDFLLLAGLAIIYNSPWVYGLVLPLFVAALMALVLAEERYLVGRFGEDYLAYCRRVPRFVPNWAALGRTLAPMHYDWRRALRKEYGTTFAWLSAALVMFIWERLRNGGYPQFERSIDAALIAFIPLTAAWYSVRRLKLRKRLAS